MIDIGCIFISTPNQTHVIQRFFGEAQEIFEQLFLEEETDAKKWNEVAYFEEG